MLQRIKKLLVKKKKANENQIARIEQLRHALALVLLGICCYGFYWYSSDQKLPERMDSKPEFDGVFDNAFSTLSDEAVFEKQQHQIDELKEIISKKVDSKDKKEGASLTALGEAKALIAEMRKDLERLASENKKIKETLQGTLLKNTPTDRASIATRPASREDIHARERARLDEEKERFSKAGLETVRFNYRLREKKEERTPENYVWAGTFVEGRLLSGAKGDAGINGTKNMGTALIRLDSEGIMPNNQHSRLNGCFALVSTYGDLSDDAVVMHLETLSCAKPNLSFEQKIYGSVFDLDAMQDLRGTSILKTKPLLKYSAAAGILSGMGEGLKNYGSAQSFNPQTGAVTTYSSAMNLVQSAAGNGLSNPANRISDYIMKIADIYHPMVIARAGRRVSVMFSKGFWIDRVHQRYESGKAIDEPQAQSDSGISTTISRVGNQPPEEVSQTASEDQPAQQFLNQNGLSNEPLFTNVHSKGDKNHD